MANFVSTNIQRRGIPIRQNPKYITGCRNTVEMEYHLDFDSLVGGPVAGGDIFPIAGGFSFGSRLVSITSIEDIGGTPAIAGATDVDLGFYAKKTQSAVWNNNMELRSLSLVFEGSGAVTQPAASERAVWDGVDLSSAVPGTGGSIIKLLNSDYDLYRTIGQHITGDDLINPGDQQLPAGDLVLALRFNTIGTPAAGTKLGWVLKIDSPRTNY